MSDDGWKDDLKAIREKIAPDEPTSPDDSGSCGCFVAGVFCMFIGTGGLVTGATSNNPSYSLLWIAGGLFCFVMFWRENFK